MNNDSQRYSCPMSSDGTEEQGSKISYTTIIGGLRAELGSFKSKADGNNLHSGSDSSTNSTEGECTRDMCHRTVEPKKMLDTAQDESLRSIGGTTEELIRTKMELARLKGEAEKEKLQAQEKEAAMTRRMYILGKEKERLRRRLSNLPEATAKSAPSSWEKIRDAEPFSLFNLMQERCDYDPNHKIGSSRTIDPDELLWSKASMEFDHSGVRGNSSRRVSMAVDRRSLTRKVSSKRLRDHLGNDAMIAEPIMRSNSHRRRGSTFW